MAAVNRLEAVRCLRLSLKSYQEQIKEAKSYKDNLLPESESIVIGYEKNGIDALISEAIETEDFFDKSCNRELFGYIEICKVLDKYMETDFPKYLKSITEIEDDITDLELEEKIATAIKYADLTKEIMDEIGDPVKIALMMVITSGVLLGIAATGYGAVAELIGSLLLCIGAAFSGTDVIYGITGLVKFYRKVQTAKNDDELKEAGELFGDSIAKLTVDGLFLVLSFCGLKKANARINEGAYLKERLQFGMGSKRVAEESYREIKFTDEISKLKRTENFTDEGVRHVMNGTINKRGQATGYHYEGVPYSSGSVIKDTVTKPDAQGIYSGKVTVNGVPKRAASTFFPKDLTAQQVIDAVNEAFKNRYVINGNVYKGTTSKGICIEMYLDDMGKIKSAFPLEN
jgi:hypothetical protein